jgi:hypothetical protein
MGCKVAENRVVSSVNVPIHTFFSTSIIRAISFITKEYL